MASVTDTDHGARALTERLQSLARAHAVVRVGILEKDGSAARPAPDRKKGEGDAIGEALTIIEIAVCNEFGLGVPERSFIRGWFDQNEADLREKLSKVMAPVARGERTTQQALDRFGLWCVGQIQARISRHGDGTYAENAPRTIAEKGSSAPLIDTGLMRSAISHEVEVK